MDDEEIRQKNSEVYQKEMELSGTILKKNRHNAIYGNWYGPDPEPNEPGPDCKCAGCGVYYG